MQKRKRKRKKELEKKSNELHEVISKYELLRHGKEIDLIVQGHLGKSLFLISYLLREWGRIEVNLHGKCHFDWETLSSQIDSLDFQPTELRNRGCALTEFGKVIAFEGVQPLDLKGFMSSESHRLSINHLTRIMFQSCNAIFGTHKFVCLCKSLVDFYA